MAINRPEIKNTLGHRFATDTAISWVSKKPTSAAPPNNVPTFAGQLVAVQVAPGECELYVGSADQSRWMRVVS